jgi:hypothetical protein
VLGIRDFFLEEVVGAVFFFEDRTAEATLAAATTPMAIFEPVPRLGEIFFLRFFVVFPMADRTGFEATARASFLGFAALRATGFLAMGFLATVFLTGFFAATVRLGAFAGGRFAEAFGFALAGFALALILTLLVGLDLFLAGFAAFFVDLAIGVYLIRKLVPSIEAEDCGFNPFSKDESQQPSERKNPMNEAEWARIQILRVGLQPNVHIFYPEFLSSPN